jgi:hypothetical protein
MAQIAYNNKQLEATGQTPYFANHRRNPNLFQQTFSSPKAKAAIKTAEEIKAIHKDISKRTLYAQNQSISYVNKKRKTAPQLKKRDKVYLHTKNLHSKQPSKKLNHVKVGPFLVSKKNRPVTYTLKLLTNTKIHPRFHINLLEPANKNTLLQRT